MQQLAQQLASRILSVDLPEDERFLEGDLLPSGRDLARELDCSPTTVQRAYAILEESGLAVTRSLRRRFVTRNIAAIRLRQATTDLHAACETLRGAGYTTGDLTTALRLVADNLEDKD